MKNDNYRHKRNSFYLVLAWIMAGLLIMCLVFFTYINEPHKLSFSINDNDIYEVDKTIIPYGGPIEQRYRVLFYATPHKKDINYLRIVADGITNDSTSFYFSGGFLDEKSEYCPTYEMPAHSLTNGVNDYVLDSTDYDYVMITVDGMESIVIKKIQFRESVRSIPVKKACIVAIIAGLIYIAFSLLLYKSKKKSPFYNWINEQAEITLKMPTFPANNLASVRCLLFFSIIFISFLLQIYGGERAYNRYFHFYILIQIAITFIATLVLADKCHPVINTGIDRLSLTSCGVLTAYMILSDLFVDKTFRFAGIGVFATLFLFGINWASRRNMESYIQDIERAAQWFLAVLILLSLFGNNSANAGRFSGPLTNASIYALYLGGIWAVLLGSMEDHVFKQRGIATRMLTGVEMLASLALALLSQSLTPLIAIIIVTALWVFRIAARKKGTGFAIKLFIIMAIIGSVALTGLIWYARTTGVESGSRLVEKIQSASLSTMLSNRNYYWREYLNHMNLLGHSKKPYLWDHRILPHNALIGMMYWYGVPCVIPYVLMMMMAVEKSWRYANTGLKYAAVPFYSIVSFVIMSMADNVEQPFVWLPWITCYLMMAPILVMPVEEIEAMKTGRSDAE